MLLLVQLDISINLCTKGKVIKVNKKIYRIDGKRRLTADGLILYNDNQVFYPRIDQCGYIRIGFNRKTVYLHILAYAKYHNIKLSTLLAGIHANKFQIDHVDGDKLNNSNDNLRKISISKNAQNKLFKFPKGKGRQYTHKERDRLNKALAIHYIVTGMDYPGYDHPFKLISEIKVKKEK